MEEAARTDDKGKGGRRGKEKARVCRLEKNERNKEKRGTKWHESKGSDRLTEKRGEKGKGGDQNKRGEYRELAPSTRVLQQMFIRCQGREDVNRRRNPSLCPVGFPCGMASASLLC